jgi:hypothetical protein
MIRSSVRLRRAQKRGLKDGKIDQRSALHALRRLARREDHLRSGGLIDATNYIAGVLQRRFQFEPPQQRHKTIEFAIVERIANGDDVFDHGERKARPVIGRRLSLLLNLPGGERGAKDG